MGISSSSNGSGQSHRIDVRVTIEPTLHCHSMILIHPNCDVGYGVIDIAQHIRHSEVVSGRSSRSVCTFLYFISFSSVITVINQNHLVHIQEIHVACIAGCNIDYFESRLFYSYFWTCDYTAVESICYELTLVLAMSPGNPAVVRFLSGGSVLFRSRTGKKPDPLCLVEVDAWTGHKPPHWNRVDTCPRLVLFGSINSAPVLSIWVRIVSWPDQYIHSAVITALSQSAFRIAIQLIFVEWQRYYTQF